MRRAVAALLVAFVLIHAPWRLAALFVEVLVVPGGTVRLTADDTRYWDALDLERRLLSMGWKVGYRPALNWNGGAAYGLTDPDERTVTVDAGLHWNARLAVLAHEGGHTLQPGWLTRNQSEAFAESVAMLVSHDGLREHARYLSQVKADFVLVAIVEWRAIYHAAAVLEDR